MKLILLSMTKLMIYSVPILFINGHGLILWHADRHSILLINIEGNLSLSL